VQKWPWCQEWQRTKLGQSECVKSRLKYLKQI